MSVNTVLSGARLMHISVAHFVALYDVLTASVKVTGVSPFSVVVRSYEGATAGADAAAGFDVVAIGVADICAAG